MFVFSIEIVNDVCFVETMDLIVLERNDVHSDFLNEYHSENELSDYPNDLYDYVSQAWTRDYDWVELVYLQCLQLVLVNVNHNHQSLSSSSSSFFFVSFLRYHWIDRRGFLWVHLLVELVAE